MAEVWLCPNGSNVGGMPLAEMSLKECVALLGLGESDYQCDLSKRFPFGLPSRFGNRDVAVVVGQTEAMADGWKPGVYRSPVSPEQAVEICKSKCRSGEGPH